jgi:hypothetical protein
MRVAISHFATSNHLPGTPKAVITFCGLSLPKLNMAIHTHTHAHTHHTHARTHHTHAHTRARAHTHTHTHCFCLPCFQFPKYFRKFSLNMCTLCCNVTACITSSLTVPTVNTRSYHLLTASKGKVTPLQAPCGPEGE